MQQWLKEVARGKKGSKDLSYEQTLEAAKLIINNSATDVQKAAYFIALRMKTESPQELLGFIHAFQEHSHSLVLDSSVTDKLIDFAGPYTGRNSFMATIPVSILLAEYGLPSFLHSSESLPPKYGTTIKSILSSLGLNVDEEASQVAKEVGEVGLGFVWTEKYCRGLADLRSIREQIGVRTLLNTVEKLLNIAGASSLMMGAFHRTAINKLVPVFSRLSYKNVFIVQGLEGSEDLPVHRKSFVYKITNQSADSFIVDPEEYGLLNKHFDKTQVLSVEKQKEIVLTLLNGEKPNEFDYYYKQVVFNAGLRYYLFGAALTVKEGIHMAKDQLANQKGIKQLSEWKKIQARK